MAAKGSPADMRFQFGQFSVERDRHGKVVLRLPPSAVKSIAVKSKAIAVAATPYARQLVQGWLPAITVERNRSPRR